MATLATCPYVSVRIVCRHRPRRGVYRWRGSPSASAPARTPACTACLPRFPPIARWRRTAPAAGDAMGRPRSPTFPNAPGSIFLPGRPRRLARRGKFPRIATRCPAVVDIRGRLLKALGRREEAVADFRRALAKRPDLKTKSGGLQAARCRPVIAGPSHAPDFVRGKPCATAPELSPKAARHVKLSEEHVRLRSN
jgi:hypothetical protein